MSKQAAFAGNDHAAGRVTPFFETVQEVKEYADKFGIDYSFIKQISNWKEHMEWNSSRVGLYAQHQVSE